MFKSPVFDQKYFIFAGFSFTSVKIWCFSLFYASVKSKLYTFSLGFIVLDGQNKLLKTWPLRMVIIILNKKGFK